MLRYLFPSVQEYCKLPTAGGSVGHVFSTKKKCTWKDFVGDNIKIHVHYYKELRKNYFDNGESGNSMTLNSNSLVGSFQCANTHDSTRKYTLHHILDHYSGDTGNIRYLWVCVEGTLPLKMERRKYIKMQP